MRTVEWVDEHLEETLLVILLVMISIAMLAQVVARYVLNNSMSWPEEFCRYCYIWSMFLSLGYTLRKGNMLRVGVVTDILPARIQGIISITVNVLIIIMLLALLNQSQKTVHNIRTATGEISSAMQIPMWMMYLSAPIGFGIALLRASQALVASTRRFGIGMKEESTFEETEKEAEEAIREVVRYNEDGGEI